jgi:hypothetical protein
MGRTKLVAVGVLGMLQLVVLVSLALAGPSDHPHRAPFRIAAPAVVATVMVERVNALPDASMDAQAVATPADARRSVERGRSVAAIVVDLRVDKDTLYLAGANGSALNREILKIVEDLETPFGRSVVVRDLVPAEPGPGRASVYALAGLVVVLGFVVAVVITWLDGPVPPNVRAGARRLTMIAGISAVVGGVLGVAAALLDAGALTTWWFLAAVVVLVCALTTLALESVFGVVGIGIASTLFVLTAAPLLSLTHPLMLPEPWATLTSWLPHGAALEAAMGEAYFGGPELRPLLVLGVWGALSVMTMLVARRERDSVSTA